MQGVEDPRRTRRGHILHKLEDIIIIGLCTLVCNGEDFTDMEEFGKQREEWLRKFLELPHGIPDSDTFRRVFERINSEALSECLYDRLGGHWEEEKVIAVERKTIRGSKSESHKAYHVVSAFAKENQLVLGEIVTEEKSSEITAVPELLNSLNIENSIITADAMSCQKEIVKKIWEGNADYVIGLKNNQPTLLEDISLYFQDFARELPGITMKEKDHGRIEEREYRLLTDLSWLSERKDWAGLCAAGIVRSTVTRNGETHSDSGKRSEPGFHLYQSAPGRNGYFEKSGPQSVGRTRGGWNTKLHMVAASDRAGVKFALSAGNHGDAPEGRALLRQLGPVDHAVYLLMDRAYEGDETRDLAVKLVYIPVVPPKSNCKKPWSYDKELYKQRNQVDNVIKLSPSSK